MVTREIKSKMLNKYSVKTLKNQSDSSKLSNKLMKDFLINNFQGYLSFKNYSTNNLRVSILKDSISSLKILVQY